MKRVIDTAAIVALAGIVAIVFSQVIARYVLQVSLPWAAEVPRYLFIWVVLLGSVTALIDKQHFVVDLLSDKIGVRRNLIVGIFGSVVMAAVLAVFVYYGWILTGRVDRQLSPALRMPMSYVYVAVPFASLLMLIHVLHDGIKSCVELVRHPRARADVES